MKNYPEALPKFLLSFKWDETSKVEEALNLLLNWSPLKSAEALELLSWRYPDERVRYFAVSRLEQMASNELIDYLPQLIQVLKHELYHVSSLAMMLLRRALADLRIGLQLFWYLRAELHGPFARRYQLLLESYLMGCGNTVRTAIMKQVTRLECYCELIVVGWPIGNVC